MQESTYLTNQFLIAMPSLEDPNFFQTVTFIGEHNASGALGIIVNRPLNLTLGDLFKHMDIGTARQDLIQVPVFSGGPVQPEHGFLIHTPVGQWQSTLRVTDSIGITTSKDILVAMAQGEGPEHALVALGYAGWGPGQLETEISQNAWLSGPADQAILFDTPVDERWSAAAALLGVDLRLLSNDAGHA